MDLSNYHILVQEVRHANPNMPESDQEDMIQDAYVRLLASKDKYITRAYIKRLLRNMRVDRHRKVVRRPDTIVDSALVDRVAGDASSGEANRPSLPQLEWERQNQEEE